MNPQPFPWHLVSRTTHDSVRLVGHAHRFFAHVDSDRIATRLSEIVRAPVTIILRSANIGEASARAGSIAIALDHDERNRFVLVAESALAASAVLRAMKRAAPRVVDPAKTAPAALAGAFAAIAVAASRASTLGPLHVAWCGDAADLSPARLAARVVDLHASVSVDGDTFDAHLYVAEDHFRSSPIRPFTSADLIALDSLPIAIPIVASAATSTAHAIASLAAGDVWLPATFLSRALSGRLFGNVVLASPTSERGLRATLAEGGSLVLGEGAEEIAMAGDDAVVGNTGDAPLVVRVEIGSATLTAREWSALKPGDVITTKQKISDPVVLRVGGVEVARGELVDVEGEVGVKILTRS